MSYARGDFYVKAVRTGLGDNQTIIPGTAGRDSGGDYSWKPGWISFALVDRGCHNETHSNQFLCVDGISPGPLEGARQRPASQKAGEQRFPVQEFRTELTEISVYSSWGKKKKLSSPLFPEVLTNEPDEMHWSSGPEYLDLTQIITVPMALTAWNPSSPTPLPYAILELKRSQSFQGTREQNNILLSSAQLKGSVLVFEPNSP